MKKIFVILYILAAAGFAFSQQPTSTPAALPEDDVVKITTSLVQVDINVTDKDGRTVPDLTAADFEVLQDGKSKTITNVTYIPFVPQAAVKTEPVRVDPKNRTAVPLPPVKARPGQPHRFFALIVDDIGLSFAGTDSVKTALKKFVDEQMQPDDLVMITRSSTGGAFQPFTSDKKILYASIARLRWYPGGSGKIDAFDPAVAGVGTPDDGTKPTTGQPNPDDDAKKAGDLDKFRQDAFTGGTLGAASYVIKGMGRLPGRKAVVLFADGLPLYSNNGTMPPWIREKVERLIDQAGRSSAVIYCVDSRGVVGVGMGAVDEASASDPSDSGMASAGGLSTRKASDIITDRGNLLRDSQESLKYLSERTGGFAVINNNNLNKGMTRILNDQTGYYLVGYEPDDETFQGKKFHSIVVKVKRPDLVAKSRDGFFGVTDEAVRTKPHSGDSELYEALSAPLPNSDMNINLSAYFVNNPQKGNFIRALLYIDGKDITLTDEANGVKKAVFDIVAVTLDENNKLIDDSNHTTTVRFPAEHVAEVQQRGLIYTVDVPVKKDGVYTFRTALRDGSAKRIGSASQIIEVPDLKKNKLLISGLTLSGVDANGKVFPPEVPNPDNTIFTVVTKAVPAIRQFRRNSIIAYVYSLYNAKLSSGAAAPNLTIQTNLFSNGKIYSEGKPQPAQIEQQPDMTRIRDYGYLKLNSEVPVGDYVLQVIVKDLTSNQVTSSWVDFEVVQ